MANVARIDRYLDLAALCVIVAGVLLYLDGTARLRGIESFTYKHPGPAGVSQLKQADHARYEANGGFALAVLGCLLGAVSARRHARRDPELN
ncbi:MAG: hypothetical protein JWN53_985 [Gemmatimonadetes bacterium]|jgi:hypothetical protein|nr:hypothetical protein [Gemmatimonadota bacterium]